MNEIKMLQKEHNFKHRKEYCPECRTTETVLYDNHHEITYCSKCGLVLIEPIITRVTLEIKESQRNDEHMRYLWKTRKHYKK